MENHDNHDVREIKAGLMALSALAQVLLEHSRLSALAGYRHQDIDQEAFLSFRPIGQSHPGLPDPSSGEAR